MPFLNSTSVHFIVYRLAKREAFLLDTASQRAPAECKFRVKDTCLQAEAISLYLTVTPQRALE